MKRNIILISLAIAVAATALAAETKTSATVRDRLWIFAVAAGLNDSHLELGNVRGGSRMTPAEGAFWLGVPNMLFIRAYNIPPLPGPLESWRAKTAFEQYAISFQPLDRVVWSVVGSSGEGGMKELPYVLPLAKKFPNFTGIYLDDFIIDAKKQPDGRVAGRPVLLPDELKRAREQMKAVGRPIEVWVTLYTHEINESRKTAAPTYRGCVPPLASFLDQFDVLTLWTWNSDELRELEENLVALEKIAPKNARIALGLYIWDFHNKKPVPLDLMKHQCDLGLKWLKEGRISDMIFLANTVLDVGMPSAEFSQQWIKKHGNEKLHAADAEPLTGKRTVSVSVDLDKPVHVMRGANLVENSSFESGDIVPEGWYIDAGADALKCVPGGGKAGRRCVKVADTKKFLLQQEIPVFSGSTYKVSAHVKTKDFSCKRGYLVIVPYGWPTQFGIVLTEFKGTSDWQLVEKTIKVDWKREEKRYSLAIFVENGAGELWLDQVKVEEVLQGVTVRPGSVVCDLTNGAPRGLATVRVSNASNEPKRVELAGLQSVPPIVELPPGAETTVEVGIPLKPIWRNRTDMYVRDDASDAGKFTAKTIDGEIIDVQSVTRAWSNLCIEPLQVAVQDPWQAKMPSGRSERVKAEVRFALPREHLLASTMQARLVSRETGKEALRHEVRGPAAVTKLELDVRHLPWGAYDLHVSLLEAGGRPMVSTKRLATILPGGKQQVRVLNNLVSELMDAQSRGLLGQTRIEFMNPRDGWVWFRAAGACALKMNDASLLTSEADKPAAEAMRLLPAGKHVLEVTGQPSELNVRAIPALVYNIYWPDAPGGQRIEPFGRHTWKRLSKHMLPNVNTIESVVVDTPEHKAWLAQGKHWTPHVQAPGLIDKQEWTVEKMRAVWLNPGKPTGWPARPSFTLDKFTGISVDEYAGSGPSAEIVRMTISSIADLADHPSYAGKSWVPWFASTRGANAEDRPFLKTVLGNGWPFKEEVYLSEMPTETEDLAAIRNGLSKVASKYEAASPESVRRMIFVLSYSGLGTMSANRYPQADFRVHLDMQMQALATDPAYFGLWGVEAYRSHNTDEEILNCMGMLLRHYCIEGKTARMLNDPYELRHVTDPDFEKGTTHWQVAGAVSAGQFTGYGNLQGRYPTGPIGDTFVRVKRSNVVSQQLQRLKPGRLYSLKLISADYADLLAGKSRKTTQAVSIALDGAEILPGGFSHPFRSGREVKQFTAKTPFWMTYHWLRFRATGPTAKLSITPAGPVGQEIICNFVEVQPVLED